MTVSKVCRIVRHPQVSPQRRDTQRICCLSTSTVSVGTTRDSSLRDSGAGTHLIPRLATARHPPVLLPHKGKRFACKPAPALPRHNDNPLLYLMQ